MGMGIFNNRTVIITGGTSGIGKSTAFLMAEEGAYVIVVGRNTDKGQKIVSQIEENNGKAVFLECDVSKEENIIRLKKDVLEVCNRIDILFNNAGIWITEPLSKIDEQTYEKVLDVNLKSVLFMMKHFATDLKKAKGVIINNASMGGLENYTNGTKQYMYCSAKAGVIKISKLAAKDMAPDVRVNCICPGLIDTEIFINRDFSRFDGKIPLGRMGDPNDVAKAVSFLASDSASYITGAVLTIDGGASLT